MSLRVTITSLSERLLRAFDCMEKSTEDFLNPILVHNPHVTATRPWAVGQETSKIELSESPVIHPNLYPQQASPRLAKTR